MRQLNAQDFEDPYALSDWIDRFYGSEVCYDAIHIQFEGELMVAAGLAEMPEPKGGETVFSLLCLAVGPQCTFDIWTRIAEAYTI